MSNNLPTPGSTWAHKSGHHYLVLIVTNERTTKPEEYPITVVYKRLSDGSIWSRPFDRWHTSFQLAGH